MSNVDQSHCVVSSLVLMIMIMIMNLYRAKTIEEYSKALYIKFKKKMKFENPKLNQN